MSAWQRTDARRAARGGTGRWEQQLAALFYRSGWTNKELATKEGRSQTNITQLLQFGRFLAFFATANNVENLPNNLTESRFRNYLVRTEKGNGNERIRFLAVIKMMRGETILSRPTAPLRHGPAIKEKFGDGKWHPFETIADAVEAPREEIRASLDQMYRKGTYGAKAERKLVGTEMHYRIFPMERAISVKELVEKLKPIIKELMLQGRANMATVSPPTVLYNAGKLQKLLDEWLGEDE